MCDRPAAERAHWVPSTLRAGARWELPARSKEIDSGERAASVNSTADLSLEMDEEPGE